MSPNFRIVTVGYGEPALIVAIILASIVSFFVARQCVRLLAMPGQWTRIVGWVTLPFVGIVSFSLPSVFLIIFYLAFHGSYGFVCTYPVRWSFLIPVLAAVVAGVARHGELARKHAAG